MEKKWLILGVLAVVGFTMARPANAEFFRSPDDLYTGVLELSDDVMPGSEYYANAIVRTFGENGPVIYVIFYNHKGEDRVLGAFRCDKQFEVMETMTNDLRDIRCVRENVFSEQTSVLLKADANGMYSEFQE